MTFLIQNSRFKIQNELNLRVVQYYSQVFLIGLIGRVGVIGVIGVMGIMGIKGD